MSKEQIVFSTIQMKLSELIPADYNPRIMTEKQNEDLKKSLTKFGLAEIPVINHNKVIIAGHQRIRLMADLYGLDYVIDVRIPNRQLTIKEEKEYNIRSNKNVGSWDWDKLGQNFETESLIDWGFEPYEVDDKSDFSEEDFIDDEKKKSLDKAKVCPHCGGEL